ncbi:hypothetical protein LPJ64_006048, partial [Coemansia asiatica]
MNFGFYVPELSPSNNNSNNGGADNSNSNNNNPGTLASQQPTLAEVAQAAAVAA